MLTSTLLLRQRHFKINYLGVLRTLSLAAFTLAAMPAQADNASYFSTSVLGHYSYTGSGGGHNASRQKSTAPPAHYTEPPLVPHGVPVTIDTNVYYRSASARLDSNDRATLDQMLGRVDALDPGYGMGRIGYVTGLQATGNTDSLGGFRANQRLGQRRATGVKRYLVSQGVNRAAIASSSLGEQHPIASNRSARGRAQNRRTDVQTFTVQAR